jgi:hypothetical protein
VLGLLILAAVVADAALGRRLTARRRKVAAAPEPKGEEVTP